MFNKIEKKYKQDFRVVKLAFYKLTGNVWGQPLQYFH